jgi:hypothetical protein
MTTPPFGQPEPFDPARVPTPVARPRPASSRRLLPIVGAVALALVAFGGGYVVANATTSKTAGAGTAFAGGDGGGQGFGPNASGRPRNGGFGGGASGTIGSVSADQMTITTQAGGSRIVLLTPTTTVTQVTAATKAVADLTSGETVTVVGTSNPDGSVTATRVIIGDVGTFLGGGRGFGGGGANASAAPSSAP